MPTAALAKLSVGIATTPVDYILPLAKIASCLMQLADSKGGKKNY
jgi:hypothetical protein